MGGIRGTRMWCPECKSITVCRAVSTTALGKPSGQRWYKTTHRDIQWFRRGRECQGCFRTWLTAELPENLVEELTELRDALADVKKRSKTYAAAAEDATSALADLNNTLERLRALKIYQAQP